MGEGKKEGTLAGVADVCPQAEAPINKTATMQV
jgi:hypothetical protein